MDPNINPLQQPIPPLPPNEPEKSKFAAIIISIAIVIVLAGGLAWYLVKNQKQEQNSQPTTLNNNQQKTSMNNDLKSQLETTINKLKAAADNSDYETFAAMMELSKGKQLPPKDQMEMQYKSLSKSLNNVTSGKFIKVEQSGDYAGYYVQTHLDNKEYTTVAMLKFHKVDGSWKMSGQTGNSWDNPSKTIESGLSTEPYFKLPGQPGYKEE